jgi:hypothetical protein
METANGPSFPSGTVTFLFTDIEGSTALWERDRAAMAVTVDHHLALMRAAIGYMVASSSRPSVMWSKRPSRPHPGPRPPIMGQRVLWRS